jgi:ribokinase
MKSKHVVVLGGMNIDLVATTARFPRPGETVVGNNFYKGFGGKGANQAVQAARLGVPVSYIGCVGDDDFGKEMVSCMKGHGIDTQHMQTVKGCASGTAIIFVDADAQNEIVVISGANDELRPESIRKAEDTIASAALLVTPFDIPLESVHEAVALAAVHGVPSMVNPAPVLSEKIDPSLLSQVGILVPNETEAESLTGVSHKKSDFAEAAIGRLKEAGAQQIIITLGENGSMLADAERTERIPAFEVGPVDTTAAGDAFIGGLAAGYQFFPHLPELIRFASAAAAIAVTKEGAQASLPDRKEVEAFLLDHDPSLLGNFHSMI